MEFLTKSKPKKAFFTKNRGVRVVFAALLLVGGVVGCILPFAPGIPLLLLGGYLLNPSWFKQKIQTVKSKRSNKK